MIVGGSGKIEKKKFYQLCPCVATTGTTLAAPIRLYGDSVHSLLYDKPVALSVPVW